MAIHVKISVDMYPMFPMRYRKYTGRSIYNRLKNCSNITIDTIMGTWFPLPNEARIPQWYVCQRIIYLMAYQVIKLGSIVTIKGDETVDILRNQHTTINRSFGQ